jgi:hypothetical protein
VVGTPAGSAAASGGEVLALHAALTNSDYQMPAPQDGYLIVVPKPADLSVDNQAVQSTVLAVEIDAQMRAQALQEQRRQQADLLAHAGTAPTYPARRPSLPDPEDLRRLMQQIARDRLGESAGVLGSLRNQPVLQWSATEVPKLLNVMEPHE